MLHANERVGQAFLELRPGALKQDSRMCQLCPAFGESTKNDVAQHLHTHLFVGDSARFDRCPNLKSGSASSTVVKPFRITGYRSAITTRAHSVSGGSAPALGFAVEQGVRRVFIRDTTTDSAIRKTNRNAQRGLNVEKLIAFLLQKKIAVASMLSGKFFPSPPGVANRPMLRSKSPKFEKRNALPFSRSAVARRSVLRWQPPPGWVRRARSARTGAYSVERWRFALGAEWKLRPISSPPDDVRRSLWLHQCLSFA